MACLLSHRVRLAIPGPPNGSATRAVPARSSGLLGGHIPQAAMAASCVTHEEVWMPHGRPIAARTSQFGKPALQQHPRNEPCAEEPDQQPVRCFDLDYRFVADGDHYSHDRPTKAPQKEAVPPSSYLTPKSMASIWKERRPGSRRLQSQWLPSRLIPHRHRPRAELQPAHELQVDTLR